MCLSVARRVACIVASADNRRAGSSLPSTSTDWLRSDPAMRSATRSACPSGWVMLRVKPIARPTVATTATAITPSSTQRLRE